MRDIGKHIQRYRLSRYASPATSAGPVRSKLHWLWMVAALWIAWAGLLSDHSFYRLWRMSAENTRMDAEILRLQAEIRDIEAEGKDPHAQRERIEALLRVRMAREDEIVYRIRDTPRESLPN